MRGRRMAVVFVSLAGLLLAGCAMPEGVDGDLVSGWQAMPDPVGFVPEPGVCHPQDHREEGPLEEYEPVACDQPHLTETVHVGEFSGEPAERVTPPPAGSTVWQAAYRECEEAAADYLGADFRHGSLWLGVTVPSVTAWEGGARWLRCDVVELEGGERQESLADVLAGDADLALGCFVATVDDAAEFVEAMDPVACSEPHDTEFVGVWHSSDTSYPAQDNDDAWRRIHDNCAEQVAEYVDVPVDGDLRARSGTIAVPMEEVDWDNGDRGIRCYLWLDGGEMKESLAGAGPEGLPVR